MTALVTRAAEGDERAWAALVDRYASLVWAVARNHGLHPVDAADVVQTVWLKLVEHLGRIDDPRRLAGWLSTTTRRECMRVTRGTREEPRPDGEWQEQAGAAPSSEPERLIITAERDLMLYAALAELEPRCRLLLRLLADGSPLSYEELSHLLDIPLGSIGPTRGRCLDKLRRGIAARGITEDVLRSV